MLGILNRQTLLVIVSYMIECRLFSIADGVICILGHQVTVDNVPWKPPTAGRMSSKEPKGSFSRQRKGSKDDYSLFSSSKVVKHQVKSNEDLNKFSRRGSLEGHRSYFARLKQGIKNSRATRSKSIDHTKYGLKGIWRRHAVMRICLWILLNWNHKWNDW